MISGREAISTIDRAILQVRSEETRLEPVLRSAADQATRLRSERAELFKALAEIRLDMLARDQLVGALDAAERRAKELLERQRQDDAARAERHRRGIDAASAAEAAHSTRSATVEEIAAKIEALSEATKASLATDPAWLAQDALVKAAETKAAAASEKAAQAEADRAAKGKPYESDPLFAYLWKAGYGTSAYSAGALTRYFDAMVARVAGYDAARPNYFMLNEIPRRLREHAGRVAAEVQAETQKRAAVERRALEARGIAALERQLEAAEAERDEAAAALAEAKSGLEKLDGEGGPWGKPSEDATTEAVRILAESLSREDLRSLYDQAKATPTPADERIVQALQVNEKAIAASEAQIEEIRRAAIDLAKKRGELERSQANARRSGFDDATGEFINAEAIGRVIGGILAGGLLGRNLDDTLQEGYRRRRTTWNGDFGGGGLRIPRGGNPWGGNPWGGGGGGSRPSPPPSSGGGGFRTGGGF